MNVDEALNWLAELFEMPVGSIGVDTLREDVPAWDSLGVLTLIAGLDEEFGIQLTEDEILEMSSIRDILELLGRHGHLR